MSSANTSADVAPMLPPPGPNWARMTPYYSEGTSTPFNSTAPPNDKAIICTSYVDHVTLQCCSGYASASAYNAQTHMQGACWTNSTANDWFACVEKLSTETNTTATAPNSSVPLTGEHDLAECTTWGEFLSALETAVTVSVADIYALFDGAFYGLFQGRVREKDIVVFGTVDLSVETMEPCCLKAETDRRYKAVFGQGMDTGGCVFYKNEAQEKDLYQQYWKPCIEKQGGYPVRIDNVTVGDSWRSAGAANRAGTALLVAAAALAVLA